MEKFGVGTIYTTNEGYKIEVIKKLEKRRRRVRFESGYEVSVDASGIFRGSVANPYHPSVYGVGYLGVGRYKSRVRKKEVQEYRIWSCMIQRCYDKKQYKRCPSYKGAVVCSEWHNFQNFAKWYEENHPKIEGIKFELDKDLLQGEKEEKLYSPKTCVFLPRGINNFLGNKQSNNTSGYIGVSWRKSDKVWVASLSKAYLGRYSTLEEASQAYQYARNIEAEKAKNYLRSLNYLSEDIIQLIK